MKKMEDLYFTVAIILSSAQNFEQLHFFLSTARTYVRTYVGHTFFCRADAIFLSSSQDSKKKCRAVEIRADGFRAVDPDSHFLKLVLPCFRLDFFKDFV